MPHLSPIFWSFLYLSVWGSLVFLVLHFEFESGSLRR